MADVRHYWVPAAGGRTWDFVEVRRRDGAWEVRRPGKFGARTLPTVPPPGEDWVLAEPPGRLPAAPVKQEKTAAPASKPGPPRKPKLVRIAVKDDAARDVPPRVVPERPSRRPGARHTKQVPSLSREILDLLAQEQRDRPAPKGMAKCPLCGAIIAPTKNRRVRTHDDPVKGERCVASGEKLQR